MKKISLQKDLARVNDIDQLPTERLAAVQAASPESQVSKSAFLTATEIFFIVVQALLLVRFLSHSIFPLSNVGWISGISTISGIFDLPFHLLFQWLALPIPSSIELYTLLAIFCYGLLSRLVTRLYKAMIPLL
ncbi:MAG TPA: hypothetical protein VNE61_14570 [Ktedonobacteraceae bacterium]|nr:hypothetical protein [Ktedonobacteraceae bacterium]